jgi:hypothetical protein
MISAGGYEHDTVGEDMELVARLRRKAIEGGAPSEIGFVPDPVASTEVPSPGERSESSVTAGGAAWQMPSGAIDA